MELFAQQPATVISTTYLVRWKLNEVEQQYCLECKRKGLKVFVLVFVINAEDKERRFMFPVEQVAGHLQFFGSGETRVVAIVLPGVPSKRVAQTLFAKELADFAYRNYFVRNGIISRHDITMVCRRESGNGLFLGKNWHDDSWYEGNMKTGRLVVQVPEAVFLQPRSSWELQWACFDPWGGKTDQHLNRCQLWAGYLSKIFSSLLVILWAVTSRLFVLTLLLFAGFRYPHWAVVLHPFQQELRHVNRLFFLREHNLASDVSEVDARGWFWFTPYTTFGDSVAHYSVWRLAFHPLAFVVLHLLGLNGMEIVYEMIICAGGVLLLELFFYNVPNHIKFRLVAILLLTAFITYGEIRMLPDAILVERKLAIVVVNFFIVSVGVFIFMESARHILVLASTQIRTAWRQWSERRNLKYTMSIQRLGQDVSRDDCTITALPVDGFQRAKLRFVKWCNERCPSVLLR